MTQDQHVPLDEKMRCKDDRMGGEICDRVGQNKMTAEDEEYFKSRILETDLENPNENFKNGKIVIIVTTNKHREEINKKKLNTLLPNERQYHCNSSDRTLNMADVAPLPQNLPYTQTGCLPTDLKIKVGAPIVITCNHKKRV